MSDKTRQLVLEIVSSVSVYLDAQRERDEALESCDQSWGYYGQPLEDRRNKALDQLTNDIVALIDERIAAAKTTVEAHNTGTHSALQAVRERS